MATGKGIILLSTTVAAGLALLKLNGINALPDLNPVRLPQLQPIVQPIIQASPARQNLAPSLLSAHNSYRSEVNVPSLTWSDSLAEDAQVWADHLAARGGNLEHSANQNRPGQGENLWAGTAGAYSYQQMVQGWGGEKQYFQAGLFPNVSSTGNWSDVGHYTQIIWKDTTQVGCALATGGGMDVLVCRYAPSGNFTGQPVY